MNILFTSVGNFLTLEADLCLKEWRARCHIVEQMPMERVTSYLKLDHSSGLALVDAIVCMADTDRIALAEFRRYPALDFPLEKALALAEGVRNLPEGVTMRDGRKWKKVPFAIFCGQWRSDMMFYLTRHQSHASVFPTLHPLEALQKVQNLVDEHHDKVFNDYHNLGMLVRFEKGRAQIGPALRLKNNESEFYYALGDLRHLKKERWVTVKRDRHGLRHDVELFQMLLERGANETEMHKFFEEHPAILMEVRMGIPISHAPRFSRPEDNTPDFSFSLILGPWNSRAIELMELKGPAEVALRSGPHPGFSAKVTRAVDQIRDYGRYLREPDNLEAVLQGLGFLPDDSKLAVLIGRTPKSTEEKDIWAQRQSELNVKVVTYDEILAAQETQLQPEGPYTVKYGTEGYPPLAES